MSKSTYGEMVDRSLNQVLMRSLSTSLVALLPVVSMLVVGSFILGATTLEEFALALLAGLFIGTYSSIFVATPLLVTYLADLRLALEQDDDQKLGGQSAEAARFILRAVDRELDHA